MEGLSCNIGVPVVFCPYVQKLYFPGFCSICTIDSYKHCFLYGPGMTMYFLVYYAKTVWIQWMSEDVLWLKTGKGP